MIELLPLIKFINQELGIAKIYVNSVFSIFFFLNSISVCYCVKLLSLSIGHIHLKYESSCPRLVTVIIFHLYL